MTRTQKIGWGLMAFLAIAIAVVAPAPYLIGGVEYIQNNTFLGPSFEPRLFWVYSHIIGAMLALMIGPFQFLKGFRNRFLSLHRWMGRIYLVVGVFWGGLGGLVLAQASPAGLTGRVGFSVLALLWWYTGWMAYTNIRQKREDVHREWIIRNYALTFAAVTLRLWIPIGLLVLMPQLDTTFGGDFDALFQEVYLVVPWLSWVPNLMVAEVIVQRLRTRQTQAAPERRVISRATSSVVTK